ncbi:unnamed protein product [Protopolystoma xenopodis]|uniref:Uncharacterized protein n=1 Tax=Protopolystoma xenopodis TaxID=117903 RepID=A0A448XEF3_9PLAT|nr:unnamed protein product [Protopolystoma xenopodis]
MLPSSSDRIRTVETQAKDGLAAVENQEWTARNGIRSPGARSVERDWTEANEYAERNRQRREEDKTKDQQPLEPDRRAPAESTGRSSYESLCHAERTSDWEGERRAQQRVSAAGLDEQREEELRSKQMSQQLQKRLASSGRKSLDSDNDLPGGE